MTLALAQVVHHRKLEVVGCSSPASPAGLSPSTGNPPSSVPSFSPPPGFALTFRGRPDYTS